MEMMDHLMAEKLTKLKRQLNGASQTKKKTTTGV
jgi:hypothetical protein